MNIPKQFDNVAAVTLANVYFDGKVVSHTIVTAAGKKTLGLIYPGTYTFNTAAPERMDITAGSCRYKLADQPEWRTAIAGGGFSVPGQSSFEIAVDEGIVQYVCSFR
jgi:uncharacterized protein YaiE (UPF0345 family)